LKRDDCARVSPAACPVSIEIIARIASLFVRSSPRSLQAREPTGAFDAQMGSTHSSWRKEEAKIDEQAKLSRRSMLRGMALLASGTLVAGVIHVKPAYAQKMAKDAVKYQDSPKDGQKWMGVGIHGEPGRRRVKLASADSIADEMVDAILKDLAPASGAEALLFVNGFGGTPAMELYLMPRCARCGMRLCTPPPCGGECELTFSSKPLPRARRLSRSRAVSPEAPMPSPSARPRSGR
jgi:hypothetical protein